MPLQLSAIEKADLDRLETQIETGFLTGAEQPPGTNVVPKLDSYDQPMIVQGEDRTAEFKPKIKGPFKMLIAALMKAIEPWVTPAFQNSWVNYDTNGWHPCGYYRDFLGRVHLRGLIKNGTVAYDGTGTIFNLPAGYRPTRELIFATAAADAFGQIRIDASGNVRVVQGSNAWVTLEGITFRAEQ